MEAKNRNKTKIAFRSELNCGGFSLVELLVALAILMIILMALTPLLVGSVQRIYHAGDKSEALFQGQSELELTIVEKQTQVGHELHFIFGADEETVIIVPGSLLEVESFEGTARTWLSGFIPYVPTINLYLDPLPLVEGYETQDIYIMGQDTDFSAVELVRIYDAATGGSQFNKNDLVFTNLGLNKPDEIPEIYSDVYKEFGQFTLFKELLVNKDSPYIVELEWEIDEESGATVRARTRLQVVMPYIIGVGEEGTVPAIWISPNSGTVWNEKSFNASGLGTVNDVTWTGFEYVMVHGNGSISTWANQEPVTRQYGPSESNPLLGIVNGGGLLIAVGQNGRILTSWNTKNWSTALALGGGVKFNTVAYKDTVGDQEFLAAGDEGVISRSVDGINWSQDGNSPGSGYNFFGAAFGGGKWVLTGSDSSGNGVIFVETISGETVEWLPAATEPADLLFEAALYDITYGNSEFIAVGKNGIILKSTNGTSWSSEAVDYTVITPVDLHSIAYSEDRGQVVAGAVYPLYVAVGNGGRIIYKNSGSSWTIYQNGGPTASFRGVAIR